jgi:hypothetical protein
VSASPDGSPEPRPAGLPRRLRRPNLKAVGLVPLALYGAWLGMMATHELGHVVHAVASGGKVIDVSLPLIGFSQTIVHPNPREHFVVWGGPVWGAALPCLACAVVRVVRTRMPALLRFFAGFCLVANGVYVGVGWVWRAGDTGDMIRLGTPPWVMVAFGVACVVAGFGVWHALGRVSDFFLAVRPKLDDGDAGSAGSPEG